MNNPAWFNQRTSQWSRQRRQLHRKLLEEIRGRFPKAVQESQALVLAGPPGAGKGSVSKQVLGKRKDKFVNVDADEFKKLILEAAIADGSYESWIKPKTIRDLEAEGERFYPLELAALVHEESSELAAQLREQLIRENRNIVVDTVLGSKESARKLGAQLQAADYFVTVIDVEVPFEVSEARIVSRWQRAIRDAESGKKGELGGRWVPSAYVRPLFETTHARAKSQDAAEYLAHEYRCVVKYERYFTSLNEHQTAVQENREAVPVCEFSKTRNQSTGELIYSRGVSHFGLGNG